MTARDRQITVWDEDLATGSPGKADARTCFDSVCKWVVSSP